MWGLLYTLGYLTLTLGGSALFIRKVLVDEDRHARALQVAEARKARILDKHLDEVVVLRRVRANYRKTGRIDRVDPEENIVVLSSPKKDVDDPVDHSDVWTEMLDEDLEVWSQQGDWITDPSNPEGEDS